MSRLGRVSSSASAPKVAGSQRAASSVTRTAVTCAPAMSTRGGCSCSPKSAHAHGFSSSPKLSTSTGIKSGQAPEPPGRSSYAPARAVSLSISSRVTPVPIGPRNTREGLPGWAAPYFTRSAKGGDRGVQLHSALLELATLPFAQPAPDAEAFIMGQRVFEALATHFAGQADLLGLARRPTLLRKKRLWVRLRAQCALLPAQRTLPGAARLVHVAVPPRPALLKNPLSGTASRAVPNWLAPYAPATRCIGCPLAVQQLI